MLPLRGSSYTHTQSTKIVLRLLFEFGFSSSFCFLIYIFIAIVDCCCSIVKFVAVFCWHSRCFLVENSFISIYNRSTIFNLDCFSLFIHLILSETSFLVRFPLLIRLDWFKEPSSHFISLLHSISRSFSISLFFNISFSLRCNDCTSANKQQKNVAGGTIQMHTIQTQSHAGSHGICCCNEHCVRYSVPVLYRIFFNVLKIKINICGSCRNKKHPRIAGPNKYVHTARL